MCANVARYAALQFLAWTKVRLLAERSIPTSVGVLRLSSGQTRTNFSSFCTLSAATADQ